MKGQVNPALGIKLQLGVHRFYGTVQSILILDTFQPQQVTSFSASEESKEPKPRYKSLKGQYFPNEEEDEVEKEDIKR
jgi:hypothetical protein